MENERSFVNNIEDEEIIDFTLSEQQDIPDLQEEDNDNLLDKSLFTIDSLFIVVYEDDEGKLFDKLLLVEGINEDANIVDLKDENQNDEQLQFDENDKLKYNYDKYKIIDVEKVEEFLDEIDDVEYAYIRCFYGH